VLVWIVKSAFYVEDIIEAIVGDCLHILSVVVNEPNVMMPPPFGNSPSQDDVVRIKIQSGYVRRVIIPEYVHRLDPVAASDLKKTRTFNV